jgi:translation initiation factor 2B subunit (eIF-2B alpha/beta/delta family)
MFSQVELDRRIARLAADRESGASEILDEAVGILREARAAGHVLHAARALCRAQPAMASIWNAAVAALAALDVPDALERFAGRVARAPRALERFAVDALAPGQPHDGLLSLVTLSFSRSVAIAIEAVNAVRPVCVACAEGRPALEGRRFAGRLAASHIPVRFFTDAAIGHALTSAEGVVVGADAIASEWFLNKSGTRALAAVAHERGVPLHVVASRDKFVHQALAGRIAGKEGAPAEVWKAPPAGVTVKNPYFEATPTHLVTSVISDAGILTPSMLGDACNATLAAVDPDGRHLESLLS